MPTFYFGLWNGHHLKPDEHGVWLRGVEDAFELAVRMAREMLANAQSQGEDRSCWAFRVHDERGRRLFIFPFTIAAPDPHYACARVRPGRSKET